MGKQNEYSFDNQKKIGMIIIICWAVIFGCMFSLVCNYYTGCCACECLRDDPPHLKEVIYQAGTDPYSNSQTKIENIYMNKNFTDKEGNAVPKHMHQDFYKSSLKGSKRLSHDSFIPQSS
jgi:hypothetical protein